VDAAGRRASPADGKRRFSRALSLMTLAIVWLHGSPPCQARNTGSATVRVVRCCLSAGSSGLCTVGSSAGSDDDRLSSDHSSQSSPNSSHGCCVRIVPLPHPRSSAGQYLSHPQQMRSGCIGRRGFRPMADDHPGGARVSLRVRKQLEVAPADVSPKRRLRRFDDLDPEQEPVGVPQRIHEEGAKDRDGG